MVSIAEVLNPRIIAQATPDHTGSHKIVVAHNIVVNEVIKIGFILVRHATTNAIFTVFPRFNNICTYSINKIAFHTTIHANAITPIIDVALKYSH